MSTRAYVDTGVLGAYYFPEIASPAAEQALQALDEVVISWLTEVEFYSLSAKKQRASGLSEAATRRALMKFEEHVDEGYFSRVSLDALHYRRAKSYLAALTTSLRSLDALHVAVAAVEGLPLLTADRIQSLGAEQFGIPVQFVDQ